MKIYILFLCLVLVHTSCISISKKNDPAIVDIDYSDGVLMKPKNIIFLIGDGMGTVQISAAMYLNNNRTSLERFPIIGLHKTHSSDDLITDSAAGATAFSTGHKTNNGFIAVDSIQNSLPTILEEAESRGLATGLVATCSITHATPASYIAHNSSRNNHEEIALDFLKTDIDLIIGGGKKYFDNRIDNRNLIEELKEKSYFIDDYNTPLLDIRIDPKSPYIYFTADNHPPKSSEGRSYLKKASISGIEYLNKRSEKGFFIMIESSQIDWGGHENNAEYIIDEMNDFEVTIDAVMDWAEKDGETLVIVTADHETGGFAINNGVMSDSLSTSFTTGHHTAVMIPVFAFGPGSEMFSGIYENTEIYHKMKKAWGWK